jgi:peroxiredoxin (alkyl hydroperoxide reductase subunit C)
MQENDLKYLIEPQFKTPLIGDTAPHFVAHTTNGIIKFPEDYKSRWVILFSHPLDFTPVCTSEFMGFQSMLKDFKKLNTEIIGLSVGAISSHLAWFCAIRDNIHFNGWENVNITFPVIEDLDMKISKLYGMIHPGVSDTKTVRAVFIIDPKGIIRTVLYYPQTIGRNLSEIKRILIALQTTDAFNVSTPVNWMPGMPVIEPVPKNLADMNKRLKNKDKDLDVQSWFFTLRKLPESKIHEKILKKSEKH